MTQAESTGSGNWRWAYVGSILIFLVLVGRHYEPGGAGFTALIEFGEKWEDRRTSRMEGLTYAVKPDSFGYDGQFYAMVALDPTMRTDDFGEAIDGPGYRGRRILLPTLAWILGVGNPSWILQVYALLNVLFWLVLARLIFQFMDPGESPRTRFLRWFGILFSLGVLDSVGLALTDLPMLVLALTAILAFRGNRHLAGGSILGLAVLTRETAILGAIAQPGLFPPEKRGWFRAAGIGLLALLPLVAWIAWLTHLWGGNPGTRGNFSLPFVELVRTGWMALEAVLAGNLDDRYSLGLLGTLALVFQFIWLVAHPDPKSDIWRIGMVYGILMVCLGFEPWKGYWAVSRIVLPLTVAFNLLLVDNRRFLPFWLLGNAAVAHGLIRLL